MSAGEEKLLHKAGYRFAWVLIRKLQMSLANSVLKMNAGRGTETREGLIKFAFKWKFPLPESGSANVSLSVNQYS